MGNCNNCNELKNKLEYSAGRVSNLIDENNRLGLENDELKSIKYFEHKEKTCIE